MANLCWTKMVETRDVWSRHDGFQLLKRLDAVIFSFALSVYASPYFFSGYEGGSRRCRIL